MVIISAFHKRFSLNPMETIKTKIENKGQEEFGPWSGENTRLPALGPMSASVPAPKESAG